MNYGLGGKISLHSDALDIPEDARVGGGRLTTAMLYLTSVSAGGRTIFPRLGLSIQPKAGNLVFWNTRLSCRGRGQGGLVTFLCTFSGGRMARSTLGWITKVARCSTATSGSQISGSDGRSRSSHSHIFRRWILIFPFFVQMEKFKCDLRTGQNFRPNVEQYKL